MASGKSPVLSGLSSALCTKWLGLFPSVKPFVPVLIDGRWLAQVRSGWSSVMRRMLRPCLGSVGKQVVCGRWHGGPGTASVPIVALRGLPAWQSIALRWQSQVTGDDQGSQGWGRRCPCWGAGDACMVTVAWPCLLQPAEDHTCACPRPATQPARAQRRSVEPAEQAKTQASGWCGRRPGRLAGCGCGSAAGPSLPGGRSLEKRRGSELHKRAFSPSLPCTVGRME